MNRTILFAELVILGIVPTAAGAQSTMLRPPSAFSTIADDRARSEAIFIETAKVIQSPRCLNCHPVTRQPTQGDDLHAHVPPMHAGTNDHGVAGLPCTTCHGKSNVATLLKGIASVPGNERWRLAPASMAWQGKSIAEICEQIKDPKRNGGRSLERIHEHVASDELVGWAWHPGEGRVPAPGSQRQFGDLVAAWIATGARCPPK
jgi:hypothetical protein